MQLNSWSTLRAMGSSCESEPPSTLIRSPHFLRPGPFGSGRVVLAGPGSGGQTSRSPPAGCSDWFALSNSGGRSGESNHKSGQVGSSRVAYPTCENDAYC